jgi:hypothetical protein
MAEERKRKAAVGSRGTIRVSLEVSPKVKDLFEEVRDKSDAPSLSDAFRKSLAVLAMLLEHTAKGGKIVLEGEDGSREILKIV